MCHINTLLNTWKGERNFNFFFLLLLFFFYSAVPLFLALFFSLSLWWCVRDIYCSECFGCMSQYFECFFFLSVFLLFSFNIFFSLVFHFTIFFLLFFLWWCVHYVFCSFPRNKPSSTFIYYIYVVMFRCTRITFWQILKRCCVRFLCLRVLSLVNRLKWHINFYCRQVDRCVRLSMCGWVCVHKICCLWVYVFVWAFVWLFADG